MSTVLNVSINIMFDYLISFLVGFCCLYKVSNWPIAKEGVNIQVNITLLPRCAMVMGGVVSRDGLGLRRIGAPGYRAHRSVAMAPTFKGIRFGRHHF